MMIGSPALGFWPVCGRTLERLQIERTYTEPASPVRIFFMARFSFKKPLRRFQSI
jgi:hypothetical protein